MNQEKELTRAEEQVMHHLWSLNKGFVKDILSEMADPKPAYNTVSTIIRILVTKGFVGYKAYGKTHEYFPLISKQEYSRFTAGNLVSNYFNGSAKELVSFFMAENELNTGDLDEILKSIESRKTKKP